MAICPNPPDPDRLRRLIDDRMSEAEQAEFAVHLEGCEPCRRALEDLAAGSQLWGDLRLLQAKVPANAPPTVDVSHEDAESGCDLIEMIRSLGILEPPSEPGQLGRLGQYDVLGVVGRGGMGIVLKARDRALDRLVAIKVLLPGLAMGGAARRRFAREAKAAAAVIHEHVVAIHAVDATPGGLPYLVMQYVGGKSLQERLDRDGPLSAPEILRIGMQAALALAAAHAQGLIHRDVKPANILLENGVERVKITDFGLARAIDDATMTQSGVVAGTPQYMAPEQARGDAIDHRADLFSLGSVLYALCTGRSPFRGGSSVATLKRVCEESPPRIHDLNPDVPAWVVRIISRLHAKDPADRYGSAAEVADLLERCLAHLRQPTAVPLPAELTAPPARRMSALKWAVAASLGLAMTLGLTGGRGVAVAQQVADYVATALRITTPEGTLVVETDDPKVKVKIDDGDVVIEGAGLQEVRLKPGKHQLKATRDGVPIRDELISITRGGKRIVTIRREIEAITTEVAASGEHPPRLSAEGITDLAPRQPMMPSLPEASDRTAEARAGHKEVAGRMMPSLPEASDRTALMLGTPHPDRATAGPMGDEAYGRILRMVEKGYLPRSVLDGVTSYPGENPPDPNEPAPRRWVRSVAFSPDGKFLAEAHGGWGGPGGVIVRELLTGKVSECQVTPAPGVRFVAFSPDRKTLAQVNAWEILLREFPSGRVRLTLKGHAGVLNALAFSPDGKRLATACQDKIIKLWDTESGQEVRALTADMQEVWSVVFSPDGKTLASGASGGVVRLWDVAAGRVRRPLVGHQAGIHALAFSPDGQTLASGSWDHRIGLWDARSGRNQAMLTDGKFPVSALAFSPDGSKLVSGSGAELENGLLAGEVLLWDVATRRTIRTIGHKLGRVWAVAFSPDGKRIAYGGDGGSVTIEDITNESAQPQAFGWPEPSAPASTSAEKAKIALEIDRIQARLREAERLIRFSAEDPSVVRLKQMIKDLQSKLSVPAREGTKTDGKED